MIILIFLAYIHLSVNQKIESSFLRVYGIQAFQIRNITQNGFPLKSKITITLQHLEGEKPILLMCSNKPNANISMDYESIIKQCFYDVNAYEDKNKKQVLSLQDKQFVGKFHHNYNIYEYQDAGLFIGAISKLQSSYSIQAEIQSIYTCQKECRNGASCFYGVCECLQGSFGDDCSIQGLNILDQKTLSSSHLYYLNIKQLTKTAFLRILSNSIPIRRQCYAEKPQVNHGAQVLTNLLQLDHDQIKNCQNITFQVQDEMKVQQIPYYLFKIMDVESVEIFDNNLQEESLSTFMLILFIGLSIFLFLMIACCCSKYFKNKVDYQKQQLQTEAIPTYVDLYIPTYKFQEIKQSDVPYIHTDGHYCSICLERFDLYNNVKITYCKHLYHSKCLRLWIEKIKVCPLCRAPLDEQTIISMVPPKSLTLIDQITNKSTNKFKSSQGSLNSLNNQNTNKFQHLNYQRSLAYIDQ
ncbi:unnamed protein product (macronuclear) [Paramecium tetraurelia]|uniref:RING-type domain-containing protein n=1 Tax=Paramecium tetraurelia TaxID=5888 RepID=A0BCS4_PARTE|nr:uncharacterized protein GSPATT00004435001 [Paramecium tetraurelia]CAK56341.1 unnamed protein product [Paramecium tetraurelia]|eukprot:XP_001423739.1 hypothetical protein (macronuclear) [Paramecium tetraurelia strain d4-2]